MHIHIRNRFDADFYMTKRRKCMTEAIGIKEKISYAVTPARYDNDEHIAEYGIAAYDQNNKQVFIIENVTSDKAALEKLADACNNSELSQVHIFDIICDFVESH